MKNILFLISLALPLSSMGQVAYNSAASNAHNNPSGSNNSYSLNAQVNNPVFITYNNVDELTQPKVINNAYELKVKAGHSNTRVFAQLDFGAKRRAVPAGWIAVKLLNKTSPSAIISSDAIALSDSPVLLFTQPGSNDEFTYSFAYNVIVNPLTKHIRPDNYNFSIIFTMTQQ